MLSQTTQSRNAILLAIVAALGIQIPLTINSIEPVWLRAVFQVSVMMLVVGLSIKIHIPESIPKQSDTPTPEPDTIRDRRA